MKRADETIGFVHFSRELDHECFLLQFLDLKQLFIDLDPMLVLLAHDWIGNYFGDLLLVEGQEFVVRVESERGLLAGHGEGEWVLLL